MSQQR